MALSTSGRSTLLTMSNEFSAAICSPVMVLVYDKVAVGERNRVSKFQAFQRSGFDFVFGSKSVNYPTQAKGWLEWGTRAIFNFETLKLSFSVFPRSAADDTGRFRRAWFGPGAGRGACGSPRWS